MPTCPVFAGLVTIFNATAVFSGTDVSVITAGYPYVGATIVILLIFKGLVNDKVACWSMEIMRLAQVQSYYVAYSAESAFTRALYIHDQSWGTS